MEYRCQDLSPYGVVLVPPSSPEYAGMLAEIQRRLASPLPGSPPQLSGTEDTDAPTMILCNRSPVGIAAVSWIWKFELESGRSPTHSIAIASGTSLLAPFGLDERLRKLYGYWQVILPGSKRAIRGNSMLGDNTDVRPPQPDEAWKGGGFGAGGGSRQTPAPLKSVTLTLDGAFFLDGGFAGPDTLGNFDRVTGDVDAHLEVGKLARDSHDSGLSPAAIFARIEAVTGSIPAGAPPPPHPGQRGSYEAYRQNSLRSIASQIGMIRQHQGDERAVYVLMSWKDTERPNLRRL